MRTDALRNRTRVLDAAAEVFAAEGLSVPVDVVAERAGVGVGTLYRHFPTKEALFEAIVVTRLEELLESARAVADAPDAGEAFYGLLRRLGREVCQKHDLFDAITAAGIDIKSRCAGMVEELERAVDALRARAVETGAVRPDVSTGDVVGLVLGACHAADSSGAVVTSIDRMLQIVCDGLRPR